MVTPFPLNNFLDLEKQQKEIDQRTSIFMEKTSLKASTEKNNQY